MAVDLTALNQQLAADPTYQRLVRAAQNGPRGKNGALLAVAAQPLNEYLKAQYGVDTAKEQAVPGINDPKNPGALVDARSPVWDKIDKYWPYALAALGGYMFAPVIAGAVGGGAATGGGAAATYGPSLEQLGMTPEEIGLATSGAGGLESVGTLALADTAPGAAVADAGTTAVVPTAAAGTGAAAPGFVEGGPGAFDAAGNWVAGSTATNPATFGGSSALSKVGNFIQTPAGSTAISSGSTLLGAYLQSRAASQAAATQAQAVKDAAAQQAETTREALALQAGMFNTNTGLNVGQANQKTQAYNTTQANLAPYRAIGAPTLSMLGYGLGLPGYQQGNTTVLNAPPPVVPVAPLPLPPPVSAPGVLGGPPSAPGLSNIQYGPGATPTTLQPGPQAPQPGATGPKVGEQRMINGQLAQWDSKGWVAVNG